MARISRVFKADIVRSIKSNQITTTYQNLGSALTSPLVTVTFKNTMNVTVFISEDGTNDHYEMPPGSTEVVDMQANAATNPGQGHKAVGTQFKARYESGRAPRHGKIIMQGQYV